MARVTSENDSYSTVLSDIQRNNTEEHKVNFGTTVTFKEYFLTYFING